MNQSLFHHGINLLNSGIGHRQTADGNIPSMHHDEASRPVQGAVIATPARLSEEKDSPHAAFWADMARAWDWTERTRTPARVKAVHGRLVVVEQ